jgi:hypothetical protein
MGARRPAVRAGRSQARSKRSRFITLFHATMKSRTNVRTSQAYTSVSARSSEFDPKSAECLQPVSGPQVEMLLR